MRSYPSRSNPKTMGQVLGVLARFRATQGKEGIGPSTFGSCHSQRSAMCRWRCRAEAWVKSPDLARALAALDQAIQLYLKAGNERIGPLTHIGAALARSSPSVEMQMPTAPVTKPSHFSATCHHKAKCPSAVASKRCRGRPQLWNSSAARLRDGATERLWS